MQYFGLFFWVKLGQLIVMNKWVEFKKEALYVFRIVSRTFTLDILLSTSSKRQASNSFEFYNEK